MLWAVLGAGGLALLHVPAGALIGAMVATGAAALAKRPVEAPGWALGPLFVLTGTATGSAVTPEALGAAALWPFSLVALVGATALLTGAGYAIFRRFGGCDRQTAFFAAAPGALTAVIVLAEAEGADMTRVAIAQTLRLAVLAAVAPLALSTVHSPAPLHDGAGLVGAAGWGLTAAAALAGGLIARALKWPAALFLGPMAAVGALHGCGLVGAAFPPWALTLISGALGATVGLRFRGVDVKDLLRFLPASLAALLAMAAIGLAAGWLAGTLSGVGPAAGMIAFAPGSMDVMIAISLALGASPAYVAAHHTVRFLGLMLGLPTLAEWLRRGGRARDAKTV